MDIELSPDQSSVFRKVNTWIETHREGAGGILSIGGFAGTGKTTVLGCIAKKWQHRRTAYVCFTGRAVVHLRRALNTWSVPFNTQLKGSILGAYCGTVHSLIYRPCACKDYTPAQSKQLDSLHGRCPCDGSGFVKLSAQPPFELIVVDEASMVHAGMAEDLESYKIPIIYVGDHGQLPPIGGKGNKMAHPDLRLETIHRQATDNPIILLADEVRQTGLVSPDTIARFGSDKRVLFSKRAHLNDHMQDFARRASDTMRTSLVCGNTPEGTSGFAAICRTNAMRLALNRQVRKYRQGGHYDTAVQNGDYVIALKNKPPIFNGMRGIVEQVLGRDPITTHLHVRFDDLPHTCEMFACNFQFNRERTFGNALEMATAAKAAGIDASTISKWGSLIDYGYAMTCHKAQGSQFGTVLVYPDGRMDPNEDDTKRWLYTAITRAKSHLIYTI